MAYQITHTRTASDYSSTTDKITHVKLNDGTIETVEAVVRYIDQNMEYYYTYGYNSKAEVESVHPSYSPAYIRTKGNRSTADNLLNLPKF